MRRTMEIGAVELRKIQIRTTGYSQEDGKSYAMTKYLQPTLGLGLALARHSSDTTTSHGAGTGDFASRLRHFN